MCCAKKILLLLALHPSFRLSNKVAMRPSQSSINQCQHSPQIIGQTKLRQFRQKNHSALTLMPSNLKAKVLKSKRAFALLKLPLPPHRQSLIPLMLLWRALWGPSNQ
jgi:hypothetical protein